MKRKSFLMSVAATAALSSVASYLPELSPYTTERLVELNQDPVNYITGDCSAKGGMTQTEPLVTLSGNNQWHAQNVTFDLGSADRVFCIPELHMVAGSSITVASGTLQCGSWMWWLESGGGTMTFTGPNACFNLAANLNYGTGDLSDFYLLNGASMTGGYTFCFGAGGTRAQYARVAGPGTSVNIAALTIGSSSSGNLMEVSDATIALTGDLKMGCDSYAEGANRLSLSNSTVTAANIVIGDATAHNALEIADRSTVTADRLWIGNRGAGDVVMNCVENGVLVTGLGTTLALSSEGKDALSALRVGYFYSATNSFTVTKGATVTVDGSVVIGQEGNSCGNVVTVDGATLAVNPSNAGHTAYVGYVGPGNALVVENQGVFDATNDNLTVKLGNGCRIVSRNGSAVRIGTLDITERAVGSKLEADNASLSVSGDFIVPGSKNPVFTMKDSGARLSFGNVWYNGTVTNVFVLGKASQPSADDEYMLAMKEFYNNVGFAHKFVVKVEDGCPDGEYNLMTWSESNWADVDWAGLFEIEKPDNYKVELHYQYKDNPGAGFGKYFKVTVRQKKGLAIILR